MKEGHQQNENLMASFRTDQQDPSRQSPPIHSSLQSHSLVPTTHLPQSPQQRHHIVTQQQGAIQAPGNQPPVVFNVHQQGPQLVGGLNERESLVHTVAVPNRQVVNPGQMVPSPMTVVGQGQGQGTVMVGQGQGQSGIALNPPVHTQMNTQSRTSSNQVVAQQQNQGVVYQNHPHPQGQYPNPQRQHPHPQGQHPGAAVSFNKAVTAQQHIQPQSVPQQVMHYSPSRPQ